MYFTIEQIDKSIYEALRLKAIAEGILPDILIHNTVNTYENALQAIKTAGKKPINLYGMSDWKAKKELQYDTIVVNRTNRNFSNMGYKSVTYFEPNGTGKFTEKRTPAETATLTYNITIICKDVKQERLLQSVVYKALGVNKALKGVNDDRTETTEHFYLYRRSIVNTSDEDFMEVAFNYETSVVFLEQDEIITLDLPAITEVILENQTTPS